MPQLHVLEVLFIETPCVEVLAQCPDFEADAADGIAAIEKLTVAQNSMAEQRRRFVGEHDVHAIRPEDPPQFPQQVQSQREPVPGGRHRAGKHGHVEVRERSRRLARARTEEPRRDYSVPREHLAELFA